MNRCFKKTPSTWISSIKSLITKTNKNLKQPAKRAKKTSPTRPTSPQTTRPCTIIQHLNTLNHRITCVKTIVKSTIGYKIISKNKKRMKISPYNRTLLYVSRYYLRRHLWFQLSLKVTRKMKKGGKQRHTKSKLPKKSKETHSIWIFYKTSFKSTTKTMSYCPRGKRLSPIPAGKVFTLWSVLPQKKAIWIPRLSLPH